MSLIYEPAGKAREYSPLALNVFNGCDHGCKYCYVPKATWRQNANTVPQLRSGLVERLDKELIKRPAKKQVLLSFLCDPHGIHDATRGITRDVLAVLLRYSVPIAVLTKGGTRCLRDLDLFRQFARIKVGATLTFFGAQKSLEWEPKAATPANRLEALMVLHNSGIRTWASMEPVIEPEESLAIMRESLPYVDHYKIGKLNHDKAREAAIDWADFGRRAVEILTKAGKPYYIKADLQPHMTGVELAPEALNADALALA